MGDARGRFSNRSNLVIIRDARVLGGDDGRLPRLRHWSGWSCQGPFWCRDDDAAKERAKQLVDGYDVELW